MKKLIIVGAGGFGREALYIAKDIANYKNPDFRLFGFIDDNLNALDGIDCDYPVLGQISSWTVSKDEVFAIGMANPHSKEKIVTLMKEKGAQFTSLISPFAYINEKARLGEGCIIARNSSVGDCAIIDNFVNLATCMVGQDAHIGDYSTVTGYANVTTAKIGKRVFIGSHSVILNDLKVGDDAYICAGSIVMTNVKSGRKILGYPAKKFNF